MININHATWNEFKYICADDSQIELIEAGIYDLVESTKVNGEYCIQIVPWSGEDDYVEVFSGSG